MVRNVRRSLKLQRIQFWNAMECITRIFIKNFVFIDVTDPSILSQDNGFVCITPNNDNHHLVQFRIIFDENDLNIFDCHKTKYWLGNDVAMSKYKKDILKLFRFMFFQWLICCINDYALKFKSNEKNSNINVTIGLLIRCRSQHLMKIFEIIFTNKLFLTNLIQHWNKNSYAKLTLYIDYKVKSPHTTIDSVKEMLACSSVANPMNPSIMSIKIKNRGPIQLKPKTKLSINDLNASLLHIGEKFDTIDSVNQIEDYRDQVPVSLSSVFCEPVRLTS